MDELSAYWMPFTANRQFKQSPRMIVGADGMYYKLADGRELLDATAGLWCCNAGHNRPRIVKAIQEQVVELDYAPSFAMGHPKQFELARRLVEMTPDHLNHVFFTNSGSESVETALKMALAYHRANGEAHRTRLIGREKSYHGVNFGGMAVGGIGANRKMFGNLVAGVDHLRHTHGIEENLFSRGQPEHGAFLADDLQRLCDLHDPSTIAAVIVEPLAGSVGVILPPKGYLERLREICTRHGILMILDEVITGFGRMGAPFATTLFGIEPDLVCAAKGLSNGVIPMGAVFVHDRIHDIFMHGPEHVPELLHGYTYSGNPMACAAALGTLDTYEEEKLLTRAAPEGLGSYWEDAIHSLHGLPLIKDLRNIGLIAGIELHSHPSGFGKRAFAAFLKAYEAGLLVRVTGDILALSPPLIIEKSQIDFIIDSLREIIQSLE